MRPRKPEPSPSEVVDKQEGGEGGSALDGVCVVGPPEEEDGDDGDPAEGEGGGGAAVTAEAANGVGAPFRVAETEEDGDTVGPVKEVGAHTGDETEGFDDVVGGVGVGADGDGEETGGEEGDV